MAVRKFILVAGQSNALEVAPVQDWEDLNPYLALRSPQTNPALAPSYSVGPYNDVLQMPYTFLGGPQTDVKGDGENYGNAGDDINHGSWQTANVRGVASQAIRYLTFYDPTPSQFGLFTKQGTTSTYPGTGSIKAGSTATTLKTSIRFTVDPSGLKITRQRTNEVHDITSTTADTNEITIDPPMIPAPEVGEQFTFEVETDAGSTTERLVFKNKFGGVNFTTQNEDTGDGAIVNGDVAIDGTLPAAYASYISQIRDAAGAKTAARVTCRARKVKVGDVIQFTNGTTGSTADISTIAVDTNYYVTRHASAEEAVAIAADDWDEDNNQIKKSAHGLGHKEAVQFSGTLPTGVVAGTTYYVDNEIALTLSEWNAGTDTIDVTGHGLSNDDIIVFSAGGSVPTGVSLDTAYYVKVVDANSFEIHTAAGGSSQVTWSDAGGNSTITLPNIFRLFSEIEGTPTSVSMSGSGGGACTVTRRDSYATFFISANVSGTEIEADASSGRDSTAVTTSVATIPHFNDLQLKLQPIERGSLAGLQARCVESVTAPENVGVAKNLGDVYLTTGGVKSEVSCDTWDTAPADGDRFVIEVQDQAASYKQWAMWLPWCPFEGIAGYAGPWNNVTIESTNNSDLTIRETAIASGPRGVDSAFYVLPGAKCQFYTSGELPTPLVPGREYYIESVGTYLGLGLLTEWKIKSAYSGTTPIQEDGGGIGTGIHSIYFLDEEGKSNPYPPGFNYPNHYAIPRQYQPFDGEAYLYKFPGISFHTTLGYRMHEHYGEVLNLAVCAMSGTSIGHKEIAPGQATDASHGWFDVNQQISWSRGEPNNCFGRLQDVLDAIKIAFEKEGDTGECVGVFWAQGEADASNERLANNYEDSARKLKAAIREEIKSRSLTTLDVDKIPFIHPKIKEVSAWPYASTVNAAIQTLADEDPYSRTLDVSDLVLHDGQHYDGASMNTLGDRTYDAWKQIEQVGSKEVDICNLALSYIGDKATVTSINPSDGSHQADLCARYYPLARDMLLERHRWDFTIRQVSLTALSASGRTEWDYAYRLPSNFAGVIAVIPKDSTDDQTTEGSIAPKPFAIEANSDLDRILYCDISDAVLRYQAKITDSTKFSQMFVHAVSWQLASMLAGTLIKGDEGMAAVRNASQMAEFYSQRAAAFDSRTTREKPVVDTNTNPWDR